MPNLVYHAHYLLSYCNLAYHHQEVRSSCGMSDCCVNTPIIHSSDAITGLYRKTNKRFGPIPLHQAAA